jgi:2,5-diketo-D-gluconate reductase A
VTWRQLQSSAIDEARGTVHHRGQSSRSRNRCAYNEHHGIVTESYSPLGAGSGLLSAPVVGRIAKKHGKTEGQVVLRWHVQQSLVTIPKSADPQRLKENIDVFGFALDAEDLIALETLDEGPEAGVNSDVQGH